MLRNKAAAPSPDGHHLGGRGMEVVAHQQRDFQPGEARTHSTGTGRASLPARSAHTPGQAAAAAVKSCPVWEGMPGREGIKGFSVVFCKTQKALCKCRLHVGREILTVVD